jgi:hypothetical protein
MRDLRDYVEREELNYADTTIIVKYKINISDPLVETIPAAPVTSE